MKQEILVQFVSLITKLSFPNEITMSNNCADNEEITILQEYLRIPCVHPDIDYGNFLFTTNELFTLNIEKKGKRKCPFLNRAICEVSGETGTVIGFFVQCLPLI